VAWVDYMAAARAAEQAEAREFATMAPAAAAAGQQEAGGGGGGGQPPQLGVPASELGIPGLPRHLSELEPAWPLLPRSASDRVRAAVAQALTRTLDAGVTTLPPQMADDPPDADDKPSLPGNGEEEEPSLPGNGEAEEERVQARLAEKEEEASAAGAAFLRLATPPDFHGFGDPRPPPAPPRWYDKPNNALGPWRTPPLEVTSRLAQETCTETSNPAALLPEGAELLLLRAGAGGALAFLNASLGHAECARLSDNEMRDAYEAHAHWTELRRDPSGSSVAAALRSEGCARTALVPVLSQVGPRQGRTRSGRPFNCAATSPDGAWLACCMDGPYVILVRLDALWYDQDKAGVPPPRKQAPSSRGGGGGGGGRSDDGDGGGNGGGGDAPWWTRAPCATTWLLMPNLGMTQVETRRLKESGGQYCAFNCDGSLLAVTSDSRKLAAVWSLPPRGAWWGDVPPAARRAYASCPPFPTPSVLEMIPRLAWALGPSRLPCLGVRWSHVDSRTLAVAEEGGAVHVVELREPVGWTRAVREAAERAARKFWPRVDPSHRLPQINATHGCACLREVMSATPGEPPAGLRAGVGEGAERGVDRTEAARELVQVTGRVFGLDGGGRTDEEGGRGLLRRARLPGAVTAAIRDALHARERLAGRLVRRAAPRSAAAAAGAAPFDSSETTQGGDDEPSSLEIAHEAAIGCTTAALRLRRLLEAPPEAWPGLLRREEEEQEQEEEAPGAVDWRSEGELARLVQEMSEGALPRLDERRHRALQAVLRCWLERWKERRRARERDRARQVVARGRGRGRGRRGGRGRGRVAVAAPRAPASADAEAAAVAAAVEAAADPDAAAARPLLLEQLERAQRVLLRHVIYEDVVFRIGRMRVHRVGAAAAAASGGIRGRGLPPLFAPRCLRHTVHVCGPPPRPPPTSRSAAAAAANPPQTAAARLYGLEITRAGRLVLATNVSGAHALALPQRWSPSAHGAGLFASPAFRAAAREVVRGAHVRSGSLLARLPREALERVLAMAAFPQSAWFSARPLCVRESAP
jgi:hypothetical protein